MDRITIQLGQNEREKIEQRVKREYPKIKNISELVRTALDTYLQEG